MARALLALLIAIGLLGRTAAPAGAADCPNADVPAAQITLDHFDASMFCLINRTRAANGVQALRPNPLLTRAAVAYTSSHARRGRDVFSASRRLRAEHPDTPRPRWRDRLPPNRLSSGGAMRVSFPHLAGTSAPVPGHCLAGHTPWLYFGFAVPDRTGGQIKESAARSRYGLDPRGVCVP